MFLC